MAPMPHRDPVVLRLALGTIVLGGAEVALFMTEWAAVANVSSTERTTPGAFGDARFLSAGLSARLVVLNT